MVPATAVPLADALGGCTAALRARPALDLIEAQNETSCAPRASKGLTERRVPVPALLRNVDDHCRRLFCLDFGALVAGGAVLIGSVSAFPAWAI